MSILILGKESEIRCDGIKTVRCRINWRHLSSALFELIGTRESRSLKPVFARRNEISSRDDRTFASASRPAILEADAKATAEGASPFVEPGGGIFGDCGSSIPLLPRIRAGKVKVQP